MEIGAYRELKLAVIWASDPTDFSLEEKRKKKKSRCCDEDLQRVAEEVAFHTIRALLNTSREAKVAIREMNYTRAICHPTLAL